MFTLYLLALKFPVSIIIDESEFRSRLRIWGQQSSQRRRLSRAIADRCCLLLREPIKSPKVISISSGTILTCCACIHSIATDLIRWKNGPRSSYYTRTRHFSCDLQWTCAMTSACHSLAPKYVECNKNYNKLFPHWYAILVDDWNNSSLSRYFNKLIIYGRQRCTLLCHLISPTRAKGGGSGTRYLRTNKLSNWYYRYTTFLQSIWIFYIDRQQYWKCSRTMNMCANMWDVEIRGGRGFRGVQRRSC